MARVPRLRLPSPTLSAACNGVSALALAVGLILSYGQAQTDAARRMALRSDAPTPVAVAVFDEDKDVGLAGEIALRAEIDITGGLVVPAPWWSSAPGQTAYRLLAGGGAPDPTAFGFMLLRGEASRDLKLPAGVAITGDGATGPMANINGRIAGQPGLAARLADGFGLNEGGVAADPVVVRPFLVSRAVDLGSERASAAATVFYWLAAVSLLAGMALSALLPRVKLFGSRLRQQLAPLKPRPRNPAALKAARRFAPLAAQNELIHPLQRPRKFGPTDAVAKLHAKVRNHVGPGLS